MGTLGKQDEYVSGRILIPYFEKLQMIQSFKLTVTLERWDRRVKWSRTCIRSWIQSRGYKDRSLDEELAEVPYCLVLRELNQDLKDNYNMEKVSLERMSCPEQIIVMSKRNIARCHKTEQSASARMCSY